MTENNIETVTIIANNEENKLNTHISYEAWSNFLLQFVVEILPKVIVEIVTQASNDFNHDQEKIHDWSIQKVIQELQKGLIKQPKNAININIIGVKQFVDFVEFVWNIATSYQNEYEKRQKQWYQLTTHEQVLKGNCRQILERIQSLQTMEVHAKEEETTEHSEAMTIWERLKS